MGSADPRAYSRNKRGIAGQLVWINFDRNSLLNLFHKAAGCYVADVDEIRPQYQMDAPDANALFASSIVRSNGTSIASTLDQLDNQVSPSCGTTPASRAGGEIDGRSGPAPSRPAHTFLSRFGHRRYVITGMPSALAGSRLAGGVAFAYKLRYP
jgi:hypothetical protein